MARKVPNTNFLLARAFVTEVGESPPLSVDVF